MHINRVLRARLGAPRYKDKGKLLTFVQRFIGHAINITWAAFRDQPLHHCVDTGSPVGTPHAPAAKTERARYGENYTGIVPNREKADVQ